MTAEPKRHICGLRTSGGWTCEEPIEYVVHYESDGKRSRTRSCGKHVGRRVQRAVQFAGAQRVFVSVWKPAGISELTIDAE